MRPAPTASVGRTERSRDTEPIGRRRFIEWLRPCGALLISNVHPANPHRHSMDYFLEWPLVYRDQEQMRALVPEGAAAHVWSEATGLNVFLRMRRQAEQSVDLAAAMAARVSG